MYLQKRLKSFVYAFKGLIFLVRFEPNAQIHLFATIAVCTAGFVFDINMFEWITVIFSIIIVWAAEAFNSAIEKICDKIEPKQCEQIKVVKDVAAGAVLVCAAGAAFVGLIIFLPKIFS
jgi:diacylglycerol kinase (ATP)